jgi:hypothetical protein
MSLRIGLNIHNKARAGQERSADEKTYLPQFLKQLNPSAIVVMDNFAFAQDMHSALPNTIVIYRQYNENEGHLWKVITPEQYVINQRGITKPGMPLYVMNEPNSKADVQELKDRTKWMVRVIELLAASGDTCVIDNEGVGQPILTNFTENERWEAIKPLFDAFKRYPQMYWAIHPYWGPDGIRANDPQVAHHRAVETQLKLRGYDMPLLMFTETGRDARDGSKSNGWRSTGISEELYAAEIVKARNEFWTEPYIRGACVFVYGSTTETWRPFDIEQAKILHSALIAANVTAQPPPPVPVPVPPFELTALRALRQHVNQVANRTRQISLELAGMSDDLLKDVELLDALIKVKEVTTKALTIVPQPVKE